MEDLKSKKMAFFMNYYSSLEIWDRFGILQREIALYNRLAEKLDIIYFFSYGSKKDLAFQKYLAKNIVVIPKRFPIPDSLYELLLPFLFRKILRECDLYKTNQNSGALAPTLAKVLFQKKFILRSGYIGSELAGRSRLPWYAKVYFWVVENISYRLCDCAFIPSSINYRILLEKYPFLGSRLIMHNNFIDTNLFSKKERANKKYDIIYVARFDKDKNHSLILDAAKGEAWNILFVGQGREQEAIKRRTEAQGTSCTFLSSVPNHELPEYYNQARICVFPSLHEGNPKALLEAMSCELPVIACNVPGVNNIVEATRGILVPPESKPLRQAVKKLLTDSASRASFGKEARKFIIENYSFEELFRKELVVYKELLIS